RYESPPRHPLVQLDVPLGDLSDEGAREVRQGLPCLALEPVRHQPLAHELLRELSLGLAAGQPLLVAVGVVVTRGVGGMDLVDHEELSVGRTPELVLGIDEEETLLPRQL